MWVAELNDIIICHVAIATTGRMMMTDQLTYHLAAYLARRRSGQSMRLLGPLVVLRGGWASSLYTFALQHDESDDVLPTTLVLKLYAPSARGFEHARREWRALTQLHVVNYGAPHGILLEPDVRHLGHPFIVMDHVLGTSFWHAFEVADSSTQARLTQSFVSRLVALHALDPRLLEPADILPHPQYYIEQELERLRRDSGNSSHARLAEIVRWLEQRKEAVRCERPVILHRDYHPWNVLVDAAERLWVIDWDWQIGDARFDLAWTCMLMQRSGFHAFSGAVRYEYARQSGGPLDGLDYFEVLTTVRWLLNILPSAELDADFRVFVVEPVRRAQEFLQERTGVDVDVQL